MGRGWFGGDRGFNYPELTVLVLGFLIHNLPVPCHDGDGTPLMTKLPQSRLLHPGGAFSLCLWLVFSNLSAKLRRPGVTYARGRMTLRPSSPNWLSITTIYQDYSTNELTMDGAASAILMFALMQRKPKRGSHEMVMEDC